MLANYKLENDYKFWEESNQEITICIALRMRGTVDSWLVHSPLSQAVWVQALARDIVLCSWAGHFTLTVPLSTQVYLNG